MQLSSSLQVLPTQLLGSLSTLYTLLLTPPFVSAFIPALAVLRGQELGLPHLSVPSLARHEPNINPWSSTWQEK